MAKFREEPNPGWRDSIMIHLETPLGDITATEDMAGVYCFSFNGKRWPIAGKENVKVVMLREWDAYKDKVLAEAELIKAYYENQ